MYDAKQVVKTRDGYRIITPYNSRQLDMIYRFLAPKPEGRGYFDNFVLNNRQRNAYWQLDESAQSEKMVTDPFLFDLWYLMTLTLAEVCGVNRNWILFDEETPKSEVLLDPNSIEISKEIFDQMASQLIGIVRRINKDIPVVSNNFILLNNGPRVIP